MARRNVLPTLQTPQVRLKPTNPEAPDSLGRLRIIPEFHLHFESVLFCGKKCCQTVFSFSFSLFSCTFFSGGDVEHFLWDRVQKVSFFFFNLCERLCFNVEYELSEPPFTNPCKASNCRGRMVVESRGAHAMLQFVGVCFRIYIQIYFPGRIFNWRFRLEMFR